MKTGKLEDVRKYVEAALDKLTPERAQQIARSVTRGQGREQASRAAQELLKWSQRNSERLVHVIRREVKNQLRTAGVATKEDVETLRKRIRELEKAAPKASRKSTAKKPAAKRSTAKKPARRSTAKKPAAR